MADSSDKKKAADAAPKKVTVQLELSLDTQFLREASFRNKALFLGAVALFFILSVVMLQRANLHVTDLFDTPRLAYHITKLWSPAFLLFLVLYGVTLAASTYYGYKMNWLPALFPLVLSVLLLLGLSMVFPALSQAILAMALSIGGAALFASRYQTPTLGNAWRVAGWAVILFVFLAFVFTYARVNENKDHYFDLMLTGATQLATGAVTGGSGLPSAVSLNAQAFTPLINSTIQSLPLDAAFYRSLIAKRDVDNLATPISTTCAQLANESLSRSGTCQRMFSDGYSAAQAAGGVSFTNTLYDSMIGLFVDLSPKIKNKLSEQASQSLTTAITQSVQDANAAAAATANASVRPTPTPAVAALLNPTNLRQQLLQTLPPLKIAYDYLAYLIAASVASALYVLLLITRAVAALAAWGLSKLL